MTTQQELLAKLDFKKGNGLIPVLVQDVRTKEILMQAYANKEAIELTLKTKKATYWSRSRNEIWVKGETSGHTQKVISVSTDCDFDSLLYEVEQTGPACHTGEYSCFFNKLL
jgi:phosphoribosyl-AMP cyclohydrolase / phosphoribosyl-ATP pyrophosphohydrolase